MKLTPLDIAQREFKKSFQGYDSRDVDSFLELIRAEWETLLRENQQQHEELERRKRKLEEYQEKEKTLQDTLLTAQRLTSDLKEAAKKEAEVVLGQAELQADKIIHHAQQRLVQVIDEINELKRQRAEFEGKLTGMIEGYMRLLQLQKDVRNEGNIENLGILPKQM